MDTDLTELFLSIGSAAQNRSTVAILFMDEIQYLHQKELEALIIALHKISQKNFLSSFFNGDNGPRCLFPLFRNQNATLHPSLRQTINPGGH